MLDGGVVEIFLGAIAFGALDLTAAGAATALDAAAPALDAGGVVAAPLDALDAALGAALDAAAFGTLDLTAAGAATALDAAAPASGVTCPCFFAMHLMQRRNFPGFPLH